MLARELVLAPKVVEIEFALAPAMNVLFSLNVISDVERLSGLGDWAVKTAQTLSTEDQRMLRFAGDGLGLMISTALPTDSFPTFPAFLRAFGSAEPVKLRDDLLAYLQQLPLHYPACWTDGAPVPSVDEMLASRETYIAFMQSFRDMPEEDATLWAGFHGLLNQPAALQREVALFLARMWDDYGLRDEWDRSQALLAEAVTAFRKQSYGHLTALEAIRAVTGRDLSGRDDPIMDLAERIVFVPNTQIGPYVAGMLRGKTLYMVFGARLPKGVQSRATGLDRAELLIRLNALADDTRLHILELLTRHDELCAQDIIDTLGLSQSTASRHLGQLSASGFVNERRREVNKCYSLNIERVHEVARALSSFLSRQ